MFSKSIAARRRPGFATPESDSNFLSLSFRKKLAREENAYRKTKVTTFPKMTRRVPSTALPRRAGSGFKDRHKAAPRHEKRSSAARFLKR
jgi:hypothetical protein